MAYDEADGYVLLFGGSNNIGGTSPLGDTWKFNAGVWTQLSPSTSPSPRVLASMVYDAANGYVLLFGGLDGNLYPLGDTWEFHAGTWTQLFPSTSPSPRFASMAYDAADGYVLLFGGSLQSDAWEFQAGVWTQLFPSTSPAPRSAAPIVYDAAGGSVLLFGGVGPFAPIQSTTTISVTGTITAAQASQNLIDAVNSLHLSGSAQTSLL